LNRVQFLQNPWAVRRIYTDLPVPGQLGRGLMNWDPMAACATYTDNRVKLQLDVAYPQAMTRNPGRGGDVSREPAASSEADLEPGTAGLCQRRDGTLLEIPPRHPRLPLAAAVSGGSLEAAVGFYRDGLGMEEIARASREDRELKWSCARADGRSDVVLMGFTDGATRHYRKKSRKLVFYVKDFLIQYALDITRRRGGHGCRLHFKRA